MQTDTLGVTDTPIVIPPQVLRQRNLCSLEKLVFAVLPAIPGATPDQIEEVFGASGSLCRGKPRRALVSCAPFCLRTNRDGRLRREPDTEQFPRLAKDETRL